MAKRKTQADQMVERLQNKYREVSRKYDAELAAKARERDAELAGIEASIEAVKAQPAQKRRAKVAQMSAAANQ